MTNPVTYFTQLETPIGTVLLTSDGAALTGILLGAERPGPDAARNGRRDDDAVPFAAARAQLAAYFRGERTEFDLPLAPDGTPFQQRVWAELRKIPYGATLSYGELARRVGRPNGARAVGLANGRNPLPIVIPCHRVIGADGSLVGYGGGLDRKRALLELEAPATLGRRSAAARR